MEKDYDREYTIADVIKFKEGIEFTRKGLREDIKCRIMNGELREKFAGEWEETDHSLKKLFELRFKFSKKIREVEIYEAMKAYESGKTIMCRYKSVSQEENIIEVYKPSCICGGKFIWDEINKLTPHKIINGKWYIEEE